MISPAKNLQGLFITGSDTGVGKTWVGCQLLQQLRDLYPSIKVRKPVESGCQPLKNNQLLAADGAALFAANGQKENLDIITPYRFNAAVAPDRAARLENKTITLAQLEQAATRNIEDGDFLLLEGAGGFLSPIAEDGLNADLARRLSLDCIIVVEDRLGAINQSLLTINAVEQNGLKIVAIILNRLSDQIETETDNLADLTARTQYPVYRCTFNGRLPELDLNQA